jgi:DNA-binding CsgD family transcriptional regulator
LPDSKTIFARTQRALPSFARTALREIGGEAELELAHASLHATRAELDAQNDVLHAQLTERERLESALTSLLSTVSSAAFTVTMGGIGGANEAGRHALLEEGNELRMQLEYVARSGTNTPEFEVTSLTSGQQLVVRRGGPAEVERRLRAAAARWNLTPRHVDVLRELVKGSSNEEIGQSLNCRPRTVETHVTALLERADVASRLAIVAEFWSHS